MDFQNPRLFDLEADPTCQHDIAADAADRLVLASERILADASGELQRYERQEKTDALGRPEFAEGR